MAHDRNALWLTGQDESVEVNQRALIDKVLARYSGEFTVFRELLQNSDDARSSAVEIRFETAAYLRRKDGEQVNADGPSLPNLKSTHVTQWTFRNNGILFRDEDWTRLRKIAEGNPDEEKIGAFGVGFYSLFSVTENPFVSSGGHGMQFYWKDNKDQLNVRRGDLPSKGTVDPWTTFEMTLREAGPIPPAFDFMRFLASSITFMVHLNDVSVYFDEHRIGHVKKSPGVPKTVDLPKGLKRSSELNIMNVKSVQSHPIRIKAEVMHAVYAVGSEKRPLLESSEPRKPKGGFFSSLVSAFTNQVTPASETPALPPQPPKEPTEVHDMSVTLTVFTAEVDVKVDKKLSAELLRSTKKNPPARLKYDLIYTGKDEYDQSLADDKNQPVACGSIFQGLRADLTGVGHTRIFIGHATAQTTGIGGHMASRFIPTVERESIDLVDRNVAVWNKELLYVGGFLARTAYDLEMATIQNLWDGAAKSNGTRDFRPEQDLEDWLLQRFIHVLKFFTFYHSTPSLDVSRLLEASFYGCSTLPLKLFSSAGVRGAPDIKEFDPVFSKFLKHLPVLPQPVIKEGARTIQALQAQGMLSPITFLDVLQELRQHPLSEDELVACLKWWTGLKQDSSDVNMAQIRVQLLNAGVLSCVDGRVLALSSVQYFINTKTLGTHIPLDGPLPTSLLPLNISKQFTPPELSSFNWCEFTIIDWLQHISQPDVMTANPDHDFTRSLEWAERVLMILSRVWPSLSNEMHVTAKKAFVGKKCIPTSRGLTQPELSYFSNTNMTLFGDLPLVQFSSGPVIKGQMEKMLSYIGVRKHVDLQLVFDRMIKTGDWSISDLVGYLVQVRDTLTPEELSRLASTAAFPKEGSPPPAAGKKKPRYCARDLYEPVDIFRQLQLPVLDWGQKSKWRSNSEEAKLLFRLGLRRFPPLDALVTQCACPDADVRKIAFKYLCDNIPTKYPDYNPSNFGHIAFIPSESEDGAHLGKLGEVFSGSQWKALGFSVVQDSYREAAVGKLGVQPHPPTSMLLALLEKTPPPNEATARQWFETLSERISNFTQSQLTILSKLPIVPTKGSGAQPLRWLTPNQCYLGDGSKGEFHSKLFVFVDFGPVANRFLSACGSKNEPSIDEVGEILISDPKTFYALSGGYENFLGELRNLAVNSHAISSGTMAKMRISPILLGVRRQKASKTEKTSSVEWDEDGWEDLHDLRKPSEIVIADDTNAYQLFGDSIFAAPQEDILESFYMSLGSRRLSTVVKEEYKVSNELSDTKTASDVRALVLERLPLFLHEHTHARTKVSLSWLSSAQNFKVKVFARLVVSKTLDVGSGKTTRTLDASAAAKRVGMGPIELWLSHGAQVDMYEVATSLCRLLFEVVRVNDALLFMTILSTDLKALKRRGYNVDKILKQQQQERRAAEEARRSRFIGSDVSSTTTMTATVPIPPVAPQPVRANPPDSIAMRSKSPTRRPGLPGGWEPATMASPPPTAPSPIVTPSVQEQPSGEATTSRPPSTPDLSINNMLQQLQRKWVSNVPTPMPNAEVVRSGPSPRAVQNTRHVTPQSNIRANVDMAIKGCKPEEGTLLHNRKRMEIVKESLDEGYCDVSGQVGNLEFLGKMGEVKVFLTKDVPESENFLTRMRDPLARFIHIVTPLGAIYNLPMSSLHVFYDVAGGLIAFNRNGSIFLNLRYFEAWHDEDVRQGRRQQAQISWFFTLAHEIAHNLIEAHNSEHEFYFSAICETHTIGLSQLLGGVGA